MKTGRAGSLYPEVNVRKLRVWRGVCATAVTLEEGLSVGQRTGLWGK